MGDEKRLARAKQRILKAFDRADGVDKVIKYDDRGTLYEEICLILEEEVYNEEERDEEEKLEEFLEKIEEQRRELKELRDLVSGMLLRKGFEEFDEEESCRPESQLEREIFWTVEKCYRTRNQLERGKKRLKRLWEELKEREKG